VIAFLSSPFNAHFDWLLQGLSESCLICSPYVTLEPMARLILAAREKGIEQSLPVTLIADISADTLLNGSTDIDAVLMMAEQLPHSQVVHLSRLHAKVYVAGYSRAIVSSANFTRGGFSTNLEYGVSVEDPALVGRVRHDIERYALPGTHVALEQLREMKSHVSALRPLVQEAKRSLREAAASLRPYFPHDSAASQEPVGDDGEVTTHALFANTLLQLLKQQDRTTVELYERIQEIHPARCDDSRYRVIGGQRRVIWKHQVRSAQTYLQRKGLIIHDPSARIWKRLH
jgi:hypothetical protein